MEPLDERNLFIWSSPAMRALETAHIVAHGLDTTIRSVHDFIYDGNFKKMSSEVKRKNDKATILLVGHEPHLSEWIKNMTGKEMKVRKGDMLSFNVTNESPLEAELQWKISAKSSDSI